MKHFGSKASSWITTALSLLAATGLSLLLTACGGGGGNSTPPPPSTYSVTVSSTNPASGVTISYGNSLTALLATGTTSFTVTESAGSTYIFGAPATAPNGNTFASWTGCTSVSAGDCTLTINANTTITANYSAPSTSVLTVNSTNPASGVAITVSPADINSLGNGNTSFTRTYDTGATVTLTAPSTSGSNSFSTWSGCASVSATTCTVTLSADTTVTANYTVPVASTPAVTVTPSASSITTAQALSVAVAVAGGSGQPMPTGSVTLSSGSYTSAATTLSSGAATIDILAGKLAVGSDTLSVTYTPDSGSSSTYNSASGNASVTVTAAPTYMLTVDSTLPASGVVIGASPDNYGHSSGSTPFPLTYNAGTPVVLTAPSTAGGNTFSLWSGCTTTSTLICNVTLNANTTVTASYVVPVAVTPDPATVTIGTPQQFSATIDGHASTAVTWSVTSSSGSPGTISSTGIYTAPYPAPASVTVKATSTADTSKSASVTVTLSQPTAGAGPALTVDANDADGNPANPNCTTGVPCPISPLIYGMNAYLLDSTTAANANITVTRWGGDDISRYNYQTGHTNSASDYYFQNSGGAYGMMGTASGTNNPTNFNDFIAETNALGIKSIGTAPVLGYVTNTSTSACSFPQSTYPNQQSYNGANCGNGVESDGKTDLFGNPTATPPTWQTTSLQEPPPTPPGAGNATPTWADATWSGGWVKCLLTTGPDCTAAAGKDATIWDLDNEPAWWDAVHRDVHPSPSTYDEVTNGGIGTALAIKTEDPAALTAGPVIDYWWNYFYSKQDVENGWAHGSPCYQPWSDPADRTAHGGVPMIVYYLQQMAAASTTYNMRLLDFLTIHSYSAATYNGSSVGLTTAGDTGEQEARLNSTRALWDPTYTDPNFPQPNYTTDANYTSSCSTPLQSPKIIPMMQSWITSGWTGTTYPAPGTSIDEYNFGGLESINGAVTQADVLGIFGKYGLTMATLWPTGAYTSTIPGNMAFEIYRNYDGNKSTFGNDELSSSSVDQGKLSVYAAYRTADNTLTIVVINKTYGDLSSTLTLDNLASGVNTASVFLYNNANLNAIVAQPSLSITNTSGTGTLTSTFPAQSITLLVIPE
jgi:hypothetical protein